MADDSDDTTEDTTTESATTEDVGSGNDDSVSADSAALDAAIAKIAELEAQIITLLDAHAAEVQALKAANWDALTTAATSEVESVADNPPADELPELDDILHTI